MQRGGEEGKRRVGRGEEESRGRGATFGQH